MAFVEPLITQLASLLFPTLLWYVSFFPYASSSYMPLCLNRPAQWQAPKAPTCTRSSCTTGPGSPGIAAAFSTCRH